MTHYLAYECSHFLDSQVFHQHWLVLFFLQGHNTTPLLNGPPPLPSTAIFLLPKWLHLFLIFYGHTLSMCSQARDWILAAAANYAAAVSVLDFSFNPLCQAGDWSSASTATWAFTVRFLTYNCNIAGTPKWLYLLIHRFTVCSFASWLIEWSMSHPYNNNGISCTFYSTLGRKYTYPEHFFFK